MKSTQSFQTLLFVLASAFSCKAQTGQYCSGPDVNLKHTCTYPAGVSASFVVPATFITPQIVLTGGTGGHTTLASGGKGNTQTASFPLDNATGFTYAITVGQNGVNAVDGGVAPTGTSAGNGGAGTGNNGGGSGADRSVAISTDSSGLRIMIAGGGGGSGGCTSGGNGGNAGITNSGSGSNGSNGSNGAQGGGGASQSGPGSGGTGEGSGHDGAPGVEQSQPPIIHAGAGGSGTAGGATGCGGGGGGVGGHFAGGGGGTAVSSDSGAGGGGGTSFNYNFVSVVDSLDTTATPQVIITWYEGSTPTGARLKKFKRGVPSWARSGYAASVF